MGRYSSVQAYADNRKTVRNLTYQQATGNAASTTTSNDQAAATNESNNSNNNNKKVTVETIVNPYGSTAGAGSGEFHIYRHARAREQDRWKRLEAQELQAQQEHAFQEQVGQWEEEERHKAAKRRQKRQREKQAKRRQKNFKAAGIDTATLQKEQETDALDEEFEYTPGDKNQCDAVEALPKKAKALDSEIAQDKAVPLIANDGTFLQTMKERLAANQIDTGGEKDDDDDDDDKARADTIANSKPALGTVIIDEEEDNEGPKLPPSFW